jgi:hypothetical protein
VEWLRSCYSSAWRLFAGSDATTRGYYYFADEGTPHFPHLHLYGSRDWTTDDRRDADYRGEVPYDFTANPRAWRDGRLLVPQPQPVRLGDDECFEGERLPLPIVERELIYGIDSRCYTGVPPFGLPVLPSLWLKPEALAAYPPDGPITWWFDAIRPQNGPKQDSLTLAPIRKAASLGPWSSAFFTFSSFLEWANPVWLGNECTIVLLSGFTGSLFQLRSLAALCAQGFDQHAYPESTNARVWATDSVTSSTVASSLFITSIRKLYVRRVPDRVEVMSGGLGGTLIDAAVDPAGMVDVAKLRASTRASLRNVHVWEVIGWPVALSDVELQRVTDYIDAKYP